MPIAPTANIASRIRTRCWTGDMGLTIKLSDGLGGGGGAHGALTNSRDARTDGGEAIRCSALVRHNHCDCFFRLNSQRWPHFGHAKYLPLARACSMGIAPPSESRTTTSATIVFLIKNSPHAPQIKPEERKRRCSAV